MSNLPALYEINRDLEELVYDITNAETPEEQEELTKQFQAIELAKADKVQNIGLLVKNWVSYAESIDEEIKRLQDRKKAYTNRIEWLKYYLLKNLDKPMKFPNVEVGFRKSEAIIVDPAADLEAESKNYPDLIRVKTTYEVDKVTAKKQLKETGVLPTFLDLEVRDHITIK